FAVTTYSGRFFESDLVQRAHAYAMPSMLFAGAGPTRDLALCECANRQVAFSTARPLEKGIALVRMYNTSPVKQSVRLAFADGARVKPTDLAGNAVKRNLQRRRDGSIELDLGAFEI